MKINWTYIICFGLFFYSCKTDKMEYSKMETYKNEIIEAENNFAKMAAEEGIHKAFLTYAADEAVLMRNNTVIEGKTAIRDYFKKQGTDDENVSLIWSPDFVDVSKSGDMGYTYGSYTFSYIDSKGKRIENKGVFHTVWKRQADGSWRFVWD